MIREITTNENESAEDCYKIESPDISNIFIEDDGLSEGYQLVLPDISDIVIEDDTPVDNFQSEKQQRLLTSVLYDSWTGKQFLAAANIGVFYIIKKPPLVPDVFLSLDVTIPENWQEKKDRTYFVWEFGKPPDVVIEIVSNKIGNELGSKLRDYATMRVSYYAVFDPMQQLSDRTLQIYELRGNSYEEISPNWLEKVGLGLTLWSGEFEGKQDIWLRWCDRSGNIIPTGAERAADAEQRAENAEQRAAKLAEQLRALGIQPDI